MESEQPRLKLPYPVYINQPFECKNCTKKNPYYILNSAILTIMIGALAFVVAFAWNQFVKESFERMSDKKDELSGMFMYAIGATVGAVLVGFFLMFYLNGTKW